MPRRCAPMPAIPCPPRATVSTRSSCSAARRTRSTTATIPTSKTRRRSRAPSATRARRCSASASARRSSRAATARRTFSAGRWNSAGTRCARPREGRSDPVIGAIGPAAPLFHWHVDTFTLPPGAAHLAESDATPIQAFRIGRAVYGIQFHFEAGTELVASWTRDFAEEIEPYAPDWFEQHPAEAAKHGPAADAAGLALARNWVALIEALPSLAAHRLAHARRHQFRRRQHEDPQHSRRASPRRSARQEPPSFPISAGAPSRR